MGLHAYLHQLWLPLRQHWRGYHPCHHSHLPRLHANRLHAIKTTNFAYTLGRALQNKLRHVLSGDRDLAVWVACRAQLVHSHASPPARHIYCWEITANNTSPMNLCGRRSCAAACSLPPAG